TAVSGTLNFAPFEMEKMFPLPILDDAEFEPDETLQLVLSPASRTAVGPPATFVIHDDEVRIQSVVFYSKANGYVLFNSVPGGQYILEASTDLTHWVTVDSERQPSEDVTLGYSSSFYFSSAASRYQFFRIRRGF